MDDLISRQAAIEALTGWETEPLDEDIVRTLENLPTTDIVHCKDCRYSIVLQVDSESEPKRLCESKYVNDDDYCSWGERIE